MKFWTLMVLAAVSCGGADPAARHFVAGSVKVRVFEVTGGVFAALESPQRGDGAIVSLFFYETVQEDQSGKLIRLLRSRSSICAPVGPEWAAGCDLVEGVPLDKIEFVRVKVFREVFTVDAKDRK